ncbi:hypothetical protein ambt_10525 [Alteromonas naphthalenivorans]|uniref:Uncharacterized protein n=1 Tax=Alteromonas naphthalenivorans TaxID=715451 RepID=F5ZBH2_ALTNA|nr:hypothetical protein ambt_10525 [Alteromonas naphthalenivorans]
MNNEAAYDFLIIFLRSIITATTSIIINDDRTSGKYKVVG